MTRLWVLVTNMVAAAAAALPAFGWAHERGWTEPGVWLWGGLAVALLVGYVLEVRGSAWARKWNVWVYVGAALVLLLNAVVWPMIIHNPEYSLGGGYMFLLYGIPATLMAVINHRLFRRVQRGAA